MAGDLRAGGHGAAAGGPVGRGYLLRFRALALTTAVLLCIIVFVGLPLQFAAHRPELANVVGTTHGVLYVVYLVTAFQLTRRLGVPRWKMALVLLAGTIPFCGFVAERKMTARFAATTGTAPAAPAAPLGRSLGARATRARRRWLSPRALVLHLEVLVVAPGCAAAGWWQATRALAGNGLSWVYSIEWPIFAVIALWGWWFLVHEDPAAYEARRLRRPKGTPAPVAAVSAALAPVRLTVSRTASGLASGLAVAVAVVFGTGIATLALIPFSRPDGWTPARFAPVYLIHAVLGGALCFGAVAFLALTRQGSRLARMSGTVGFVGVALGGLGGMLTYAHSLRIVGVLVMLLGVAVAGFGFCLPLFERIERTDARAEALQAAAEGLPAGGTRLDGASPSP